MFPPGMISFQQERDPLLLFKSLLISQVSIEDSSKKFMEVSYCTTIRPPLVPAVIYTRYRARHQNTFCQETDKLGHRRELFEAAMSRSNTTLFAAVMVRNLTQVCFYPQITPVVRLAENYIHAF